MGGGARRWPIAVAFFPATRQRFFFLRSLQRQSRGTGAGFPAGGLGVFTGRPPPGTTARGRATAAGFTAGGGTKARPAGRGARPRSNAMGNGGGPLVSQFHQGRQRRQRPGSGGRSRGQSELALRDLPGGANSSGSQQVFSGENKNPFRWGRPFEVDPNDSGPTGAGATGGGGGGGGGKQGGRGAGVGWEGEHLRKGSDAGPFSFPATPRGEGSRDRSGSKRGGRSSKLRFG